MAENNTPENLIVSYSLFSDFDISLFKSGKHYRLYEKFGAHPITINKKKGVYFAVWAPSADSVSVIGDFNYWDDQAHKLNVRWDESGIWEGFIPYVEVGMRYKFKIGSAFGDDNIEKSDPYAFFCETGPKTASIIWDISDYKWRDKQWMGYRKDKNALDKPYAVYEMHIGSWQYNVEENRPLSYKELAVKLVDYLLYMEYTHVEFMPVMEYPYDPSWGYQLTGYFAPTSRFGSPIEFMELVDALHQNDIGVILDWVPSHFPEDKHGLGMFDGTHLYEHPDPKRGYHPDWKSLIFNYGRNEVRSFLISNALFWFDMYHADGLRVDAVASMLYLDYSREEGEWDPNIYGERVNLEALSFLKSFNDAVYTNYPDVQTIAEESTAFPMVTKPTDQGGVGFGMKWMMGWMHDTLLYFSKDPIHRTYHHNEISLSLTYCFTERFMLPLSHDEVVYGKGSLLNKMPGDEWQKFANLRLLFGYMYTHPGTQLMFMGGEFGQSEEWDFSKSLDWHLLKYSFHKGVQTMVKDLNHFYKNSPALYEKAFSEEGFEWISYDDSTNCILSYIRKGHDEENDLIIICNFTPVTRENYTIGLVKGGVLKQVFNSNLAIYGGSDESLYDPIIIESKPSHGRSNSVELTIPALAVVIMRIEIC